METKVNELFEHLKPDIVVEGDGVRVVRPEAVPDYAPYLAWQAALGEGLAREQARWVLWELGQALGVHPASVHELYMARGRGEVSPTFTVPAINVRGLTFTTARAAFRAANRLNVGALIFELSRSEMGYTNQRPAEYTSVLIAAALAEGYRGPLFVQGDHFQVSAKRYAADPDGEVDAVKQLIVEALAAGFYNIDIDTSTLVDLSRPTLDEQQRLNYELCAQLSAFVREHEPEGITTSLGGEIGEVGGKNSTVEELRAFMDGYRRTLAAIDPSLPGISKLSVQTGTSHGGVVLPDGTLAQVKVDFDTLARLSRAAREEYGLGGAVQHGASTLPDEAFDKFPACETLEIHLATGFQNIIYDLIPDDFRQRVYAFIKEAFADEWQEGQTEEQFIYKTRKKAFGPLKREWWSLPDEVQARIGEALEAKFAFLFEKLNVANTKELAAKYAISVEQHRPPPTGVQQVAEAPVGADSDLAD